jgi:hypothetical protein
MEYDHSFSCGVDQKDGPFFPLGFAVDFYQDGKKKVRPAVEKIKRMPPYNAIKIDKSFWQEQKIYMFECTVQYHDQETGVQYKGTAQRIFTTAVFRGDLLFSIEPKVGTPFETDFKLSISKYNMQK